MAVSMSVAMSRGIEHVGFSKLYWNPSCNVSISSRETCTFVKFRTVNVEAEIRWCMPLIPVVCMIMRCIRLCR
jgi:hypothetical protein